MGLLILGLVLFLGVHSVGMAAPAWRERMVLRLGEIPWKGVYGLLSLVGLVLIVQIVGLFTRLAKLGISIPVLQLRFDRFGR